VAGQAPFCTRSDVSTFGARADAIESAAAEVVRDTIQARTDWICSFLSQRQPGPFTAWDMSVRQACAIAVAWDIVSAPVGRNPEDDITQDPLYLRFKGIQDWLKQITAGGPMPAVTGTPGPIPAAPPGAAGAATNTSRGWQSGQPFRAGAFSGERDER